MTDVTPATTAVQRETRTIQTIFASLADPVSPASSRGSTARMGTSPASPPMKSRWGGKWLELFSEIAPGPKRAAIMFDPDALPVSTFIPSSEIAAGRSLKVVPTIAFAHSDVEIERATIALGREPGGGVVVQFVDHKPT